MARSLMKFVVTGEGLQERVEAAFHRSAVQKVYMTPPGCVWEETKKNTKKTVIVSGNGEEKFFRLVRAD